MDEHRKAAGGLGIEAMAAWSEAAQRALTEWQQLNLDLLRESQTAMFRWHTMWHEAWMDAAHHLFEATRRQTQTLADANADHVRAA